MINNFEILEIKEKRDQSIVTVKVFSEEVHEVNGAIVAAIDLESPFHKSLHADRIPHSHSAATEEVTLLVDNPVTEEKIDALLSPIKVMLEDNPNPYKGLVEVYHTSSGEKREFFSKEEAPVEVIETLLTSFPSENIEDFAWISTPSYNSFLEEGVITVFPNSNDIYEEARVRKGVVAHVFKFHLSSRVKTSRIYYTSKEPYSVLPEGCEVLAVGKNYESDMETPLDLGFFDIYFTGDSEVISSAFELTQTDGASSTFYGLTLSNEGALIRAKKYCYDYNTIFSEWVKTVERVERDKETLNNV